MRSRRALAATPSAAGSPSPTCVHARRTDRTGTELAGCAKLYLPIGDAPPSERPFAFVLQLGQEVDATLVWVFVAFGHRHPKPGVRSVYERAHRQLHGRFPNRG